MAHRLLGIVKGLALLVILMLPGLKHAEEVNQQVDYSPAIFRCLSEGQMQLTDGELRWDVKCRVSIVRM